MSNRTDKEFLYDIQEAVRRIKAYTHEMTYEEFLADTRTQDAVIRNLEIVGEATKKLSAGLRNRYPSVPWREMAGARDRLIHGYFGVDIEVVWKISIAELPNLTQVEMPAADRDARTNFPRADYPKKSDSLGLPPN